MSLIATRIIAYLAPDAAIPGHLALRALLEGDLRVGGLGEAVVAHRQPPVRRHDVAEGLAVEDRSPSFHSETCRVME